MIRSVLALFVFPVMLSAAYAATLPPENGRDVWLLQKARTLADSGELISPETVGEILGVPLTHTTRQVEEQPAKCLAGHIYRSYLYREFEPISPSWFAAFTQLKSENKSRITIGYDTTDRTFCNIGTFLHQEFQAQLQISNIIKFSCITRKSVDQYFPHARVDHYVNDILMIQPGADPDRYLLHYQGHVDALSGTTVTLEFDSNSANCLTSIGMTQTGPPVSVTVGP
jgi:hypothetical protein